MLSELGARFRSWRMRMRTDRPNLWHPIRAGLMIITTCWMVACMAYTPPRTPLMLAWNITAIALLLVCLTLLLPAANSEIHLGVLSIFWGIAMMIIGLGMQVKVLALAPDATDVAMALFSGIFNIGIGAGALVGNQVSLHWSMSMIGYVGAVPAFAALIWSIIIFRRWPVTLEEQTQ